MAAGPLLKPFCIPSVSSLNNCSNEAAQLPTSDDFTLSGSNSYIIDEYYSDINIYAQQSSVFIFTPNSTFNSNSSADSNTPFTGNFIDNLRCQPSRKVIKRFFISCQQLWFIWSVCRHPHCTRVWPHCECCILSERSLENQWTLIHTPLSCLQSCYYVIQLFFPSLQFRKPHDLLLVGLSDTWHL